ERVLEFPGQSQLGRVGRFEEIGDEYLLKERVNPDETLDRDECVLEIPLLGIEAVAIVGGAHSGEIEPLDVVLRDDEAALLLQVIPPVQRGELQCLDAFFNVPRIGFFIREMVDYFMAV